jgi:hypothetical protein
MRFSPPIASFLCKSVDAAELGRWPAFETFATNLSCIILCSYCRYVAVALLANPSYKYDLYETESDPAMVHMALQSKVKSISETNNEGEVTTQDLIDDALTIM